MKTAALILLGTSILLAQQIPGDTVVVTLNGKNYTADQIQAIVAAIPAQARAMYERDPKRFLKEHAALLSFVEYAEQKNLQKESPYREQMEFYRMFVLSNAAVNDKRDHIVITADEQKAFYTQHQNDFREARVRMIYFPFTSMMNEGVVKAKAEAAVKRAKAGEDFVALARANSESAAGAGDEFAVRLDSQQPPEQMKRILLASAPKTITDPLRHENGFYVFRVESIEVLPFEKVRDDIFKSIQNARFREWQQQVQSQSTVKIQNEAFFQSVGQQQKQ